MVTTKLNNGLTVLAKETRGGFGEALQYGNLAMARYKLGRSLDRLKRIPGFRAARVVQSTTSRRFYVAVEFES